MFARKAVHAAIGMAMTMIILGVFYIAQDADFLGVIQIFVYTGAVMMLFLFVLMLVGVDSSDSLVETLTGQRWATVAAQPRARRHPHLGHRRGHASATRSGWPRSTRRPATSRPSRS